MLRKTHIATYIWKNDNARGIAFLTPHPYSMFNICFTHKSTCICDIIYTTYKVIRTTQIQMNTSILFSLRLL